MGDVVDANDSILWCCHVIGPDDVIACIDRGHAERLSAMLNQQRKGLVENDPRLKEVMFFANPEAWPHSNAAHKRALKDPGDDYRLGFHFAKEAAAPDTAFLEGVKAGLDAAAQWADRGKATYVKWVGQCAGHDERYMAADAIRGIDPASVTRKGGADE